MVRRGISWFKEQADGLLDLFLPRLCPICLARAASDQDSFCPACRAAIQPLPAGHCSRCALPFRATDSSSHLCADCSRQSPPFRQVYVAGLYQGALKEALQGFKYQGRVDLDRSLAQLLIGLLADESIEADLIVPVPLHRHKLRQRGYNQSLLLARLLAHNLQISLGKAMLVRMQAGHSQQGLSAPQRRQNLKGAFRCNRDLSGKRLLLVDDVMTTGATLAVCSQALLDAGAQEVSAAVVARAPRY
jgi:ComF family protein